MPTIKLDGKTKLARLVCEEGKTETTYWDGSLPGFGLRCRSSGVRTWFVQYRAKTTGETRKHSLGDPEHVTFAKAREEAEHLLAAVKLGQDPAGAAATKRAEAKSAVKFGDVVERYLDRQQTRMKPRSYAEIVRHLRVDAKPLHTQRIDRVTQRTVADLLDGIADRAPVAANRARASLSAAFAWAMKRAIVGSNPVALTDKAGDEKSRDRVLSDDELRLIWHCTGDGGDHDRIVRLLMLTGARAGEIAGMQWGEITLHKDGAATWVLPGARSKNGRAHELVLPAMAVETLPAPREGRELVFGEGAGPFSGWSNCKSRLDQRIAANGKPIAPWRTHDLRRTAATRMSDIGIEPHIVEAILNHVSGTKASVAGIYNRSAYADQKRIALEVWCAHIAKLTGGGGDQGGATVVPFRRVG